jgi:hypothetical protein
VLIALAALVVIVVLLLAWSIRLLVYATVVGAAVFVATVAAVLKLGKALAD